MQRESSVDVYLDASTLLPVALDFSLHSKGAYGVDVPVEIRFTNYQKSSGILMPAHIEKLINNSPALDLDVTAVSINRSLSTSDFAVPGS